MPEEIAVFNGLLTYDISDVVPASYDDGRLTVVQFNTDDLGPRVRFGALRPSTNTWGWSYEVHIVNLTEFDRQRIAARLNVLEEKIRQLIVLGLTTKQPTLDITRDQLV